MWSGYARSVSEVYATFVSCLFPHSAHFLLTISPSPPGITQIRSLFTWPRNIIVTAQRCAAVYDEKLEKPHTLGTSNIMTLCPLSPQKCKLLWTIIWLCMPHCCMPHSTHTHVWMARPQRPQVVQTSECTSQQTIAVLKLWLLVHISDIFHQ